MQKRARRMLIVSRLWRVGFCSLVLMAIGVWAVAPAFASQVEGLFEAQIAVADRSAAQRSEGIKKGLLSVLVKVTGKSDVGASVHGLPTGAQLETMVEQFQYREMAASQASPADEKPQTQLHLWVEFNNAAVMKIVRAAKLPVWDKIRPATLVWLAVQDGAQRQFVETVQYEALKLAAQRQASERGLPLVFPALDGQDMSTLSLIDLWSDVAQPIKQASTRYPAGAILVGRLYRINETQWRAQWSHYLKDEVVHWETRAADQATVMADGVNGAADRLARVYAQVLDDAPESLLRLRLVDVNFEQYAQATKYLESLLQVASVQVAVAKGNEVDLRLIVRGTLESFIDVLDLGGVLLREQSGAAIASTEAQNDGAQRSLLLIYRLKPMQ